MVKKAKGEEAVQAEPRLDVLAALRDMVAPEDILEAACRLGAMKRQRKVDMPALVEATIAAVLPTPGGADDGLRQLHGPHRTAACALGLL
jgi:hypothetical protein